MQFSAAWNAGAPTSRRRAVNCPRDSNVVRSAAKCLARLRMASTNARTLPALVSAARTRRARRWTTPRSHKVLRTQPSAPLPPACNACHLRSVGDLAYLPAWTRMVSRTEPKTWSEGSLLLSRLARRRASFKDGRYSHPVRGLQAPAPCPRMLYMREGMAMHPTTAHGCRTASA